MKVTKPWAVVDIETTGLSPDQGHEIIEIAILTEKTAYCQKIEPVRLDKADPIALEINGYNPKDWDGALSPRVAAERIGELLDGHRIIGHNPQFDMMFIRDLWEDHGLKFRTDRRLIDTMILAHEHLEPIGCRSLSLVSIRNFLGWSTSGAHSARIDAVDTLRLYRLLVRCGVMKRIYLKWRYKLLLWLGLTS